MGNKSSSIGHAPATGLRAALPGLVGVLALAALVGLVFLRRPAPPRPAVTPAAVAPKLEKKDYAFFEKDDPSVKVDDLAPRTQRVIDIHEHVQTERDAKLLLAAMDRYKIERTCLMGTTVYTFTLSDKYGFEGHHENNEALLGFKKKWPDRFCAFVTVEPVVDEDLLGMLQRYVQQGADGLKLYIGHGASHGKGPFHVMTLDDPKLEPLWAWAEENQLPILLHVNLILYYDELVRVLERHPYLRVVVPHLGLHKNTKARLDRLAWLLERYPNLYTDVSFGWHEFHDDGFRALARWRTRSKQYFDKHADKILYASDMVLEATKDEKYIDEVLRSYFQLLENEKHRFFMRPDKTMHGLALGESTLKKIYWTSPSRYLVLDEDGQMPDRSVGPPRDKEGHVIGLPPTVPKVPPLPPEQLMKGE
jgi:predicted TIM-barrel fold metal-dependent hydrolase